MTQKQKLVLEAFDQLTDIVLEIEDVNNEEEFISKELIYVRMSVILARNRMARLFRGSIVKLP